MCLKLDFNSVNMLVGKEMDAQLKSSFAIIYIIEIHNHIAQKYAITYISQKYCTILYILEIRNEERTLIMIFYLFDTV